MGHQRNMPTQLGSGQDQGRPYSPVVPGPLIGGGERGLGTIRLPGDSDSRTLDKSMQRASRRRACRKKPLDDEAHVARLVNDVVLVRSARRLRVPKRKDRRRNEIAGSRPGTQQPAVAERRRGKAVSEDHKRPRAAPPHGRRIPKVRRQRPSHAPAPWQTNRPRPVHEMKHGRKAAPRSRSLDTRRRRPQRRGNAHRQRHHNNQPQSDLHILPTPQPV